MGHHEDNKKKNHITVKVDQTKIPLGHQTWGAGDGATFKTHKGKGSYNRKSKHKDDWRSAFGLDD